MKELKEKRFFFFDLDGVILNSMPYHAKAWIEVFSEFNLKFTEQEIYLYEGAIEFETVESLFKRKGLLKITPQDFEKILQIQKTLFKKKYAKLVKPFPEVLEILENLKREGKKLALVTSSHKEILSEVLPKNIKNFFEVIITGDRVAKRKPHPDPYLKAKEAFQAIDSESLAIENAPAGILSAKRAHLFCIGLTTTLPKKYLSLADLIVENHLQLRSLLLDGR
ncbi:MAG: HAD family phosphatase [Thermodesulfobacteriaceae bacterium]|nr:HAD family phosphatase [Thermodesulfobacteriaceae bacterium]MCX8042039.1 HAD family phosphatase [Thermodesulfobacteriaceae bacterium]MDW8136138.1 HAD family phosphatase [Thermodesulfobacterium sp.]